MVKKIAALAGAGAILLSMAGPAFAGIVVINKGAAKQYTKAEADASTGDNDIKAWRGGTVVVGGSADSGDAYALAGASAVANQYKTKIFTDCGCDVFVGNKGWAKQYTKAEADASTGDNDIKAWKGGTVVVGGSADSGDAYAASVAEAWANIFTTKIIGFE